MLALLNTTIFKTLEFAKCEKGATLVEYGLLVAVVAMIVVAGALALGDAIGVSFCDMAQDLDPAAVC
jgi:pilus assembly protein Flp/PilA